MEGEVVDDKAKQGNASDVDTQVVEAENHIHLPDKATKFLVTTTKYFYSIMLLQIILQSLFEIQSQILKKGGYSIIYVKV